ncbi:SDR family oxidoreductase [Arthrobacter silvisoli]|uniref:SDR family oxidoreductase n=1 Tax=Arthrobacter silvisoli TaxID=2291022 RepID=UPI002482BABE|nr:SDR family oxidoreductase [Arthrobacter silvisoli]
MGDAPEVFLGGAVARLLAHSLKGCSDECGHGVGVALTKGAIDAFTLTLAKHLGPRGITVNAVAPGVVDTDINASWLRGNQDAIQGVAASTALGRVGRPDDIASIVAFLASDDGRWVTGQTIDATGGTNL